MLKQSVIKFLYNRGYTIYKSHFYTLDEQKNRHPDFDSDFWHLFIKCEPFTMTTCENLYALYKAIEYTVKNQIPGPVVECGVWKGGSMMMAALSLIHFNDTTRSLYLYDTFTGMTEPTDKDKGHDGRLASEYLKQGTEDDQHFVKAIAPLDEVKQNAFSTGYPQDQFTFIQGPVERTLQETKPSSIALLRLDTDWYESTKAELENLYPLLAPNGILIVDDYGGWSGSKEATDEYFASVAVFPYLHRVDTTARLIIKH